MKKWLSALVAAILCLSMAACNATESEDEDYEKSTNKGGSTTESSVKTEEYDSEISTEEDTSKPNEENKTETSTVESTTETETEVITDAVAEIYKKYPGVKEIGVFTNGLAPFYVSDGGKSYYGYIDINGNVVIEPEFNVKVTIDKCPAFEYEVISIPSSLSFSNPQYVNEVSHIVDKNGTILFEKGKNNVSRLSEVKNGYFAVDTKREEFTGYVHTVTYYSAKDLSVIAQIDNVQLLTDELRVENDGSVKLYDPNTNGYVEFNISEYDPSFKPNTSKFDVDVKNIDDFNGVSVYYTVSTGNNTLGEIATVVLVNKDNLVYFSTVDSNGNILMTPQKDKVLNFGSEYSISPNCQFYRDLCPAKDAQSGLWGYIDPYGNWVIEPKYNSANPFGADGYAVVNDSTVIDAEENIILAPKSSVTSETDVIGKYKNGIYTITLSADGSLLYYISPSYGSYSYTGTFEIKNGKLVVSGIGYTTYWGINPAGSYQDGAHTIQKVGDDLYINGVKWTKVS